jgi:hypothetical protein
MEQFEFTWITFLSSGFETQWLLLTDEDGHPLLWTVGGTNGRTIKWAKEKFGALGFGLAPTSQKELGNAVFDNF